MHGRARRTRNPCAGGELQSGVDGVLAPYRRIGDMSSTRQRDSASQFVSHDAAADVDRSAEKRGR
jgi:hypothetical protein